MVSALNNVCKDLQEHITRIKTQAEGSRIGTLKVGVYKLNLKCQKINWAMEVKDSILWQGNSICKALEAVEKHAPI